MQGFQRPRQGREAIVFVVRQPQAFAQALGVLLDSDRQRRQPQQRVGRLAARRLERDQSPQSRGIGHSRERAGQQPGLAYSGHDLAGARRGEQLQQFHAHPLARENRQALAFPDRRRKTLGVEFALAESRRKPEETQNAQIVLADAQSAHRR